MNKRNKNFYVLTETKLTKLIRDSLVLQALSQGGVDEWQWADDIAREELKNYKRLYCGDCPNWGK